MTFAILNGINALFSLFYILILIRCALSFIPGIDYRKQPYQAIREITDPYLNIFRRFVPPIGMIDLSPIVAILVLGIIQNIIYQILSRVSM